MRPHLPRSDSNPGHLASDFLVHRLFSHPTDADNGLIVPRPHPAHALADSPSAGSVRIAEMRLLIDQCSHD